MVRLLCCGLIMGEVPIICPACGKFTHNYGYFIYTKKGKGFAIEKKKEEKIKKIVVKEGGFRDGG